MTLENDLARCRSEYEDGNTLALLEAVMACAERNSCAPPWVVAELAKRRGALQIALKPPSQSLLVSGFDAFLAASPTTKIVPAGKGHKILAGRASWQKRRSKHDLMQALVVSEFRLDQAKPRFGAINRVAKRVNLTPQRVGQILRKAGET